MSIVTLCGSIKLAITMSKYVYSDINSQDVQEDININVRM